jgi:hypothetical protein
MELNKDDYFELEKLCDMQASALVHELNATISVMSRVGIKSEKINSVFDDIRKAYDKYRTISAKLEAIRNGE